MVLIVKYTRIFLFILLTMFRVSAGTWDLSAPELKLSGFLAKTEDGIALQGCGQYGFGSIEFEKSFAPGEYSVCIKTTPTLGNITTIAFYVEDEQGNQPSISGWFNQEAEMRFSFRSVEPFCKLIVKKVSESGDSSMIFSNLEITETTGLKLPAYRKVLSFPAPWGLPGAEYSEQWDAVSGMDALAQRDELENHCEHFLDERAAVAEEIAAGMQLLRVSALCAAQQATQVAVKNYQDSVDFLRTLLKQQNHRAFEAQLLQVQHRYNQLHRTLNEALNGEVSPDHVIANHWSWVKHFGEVTGFPNAEFEEPTPYRMAFPDGMLVRLAKMNDPGVLESSWTTTTTRHEFADFYATVLTPWIMIDAKESTLQGTTTLTANALHREQDDFWVLESPKGARLLLLSDGTAFSVNIAEDGTFSLKTEHPCKLGIRFLSADKEFDLSAIREFYQPKLSELPVEAVQIQRGRQLEQYFFAFDGTRSSLIPIPPLTRLSWTTSRPVKVEGELEIAPDGTTFLKQNDSLKAILPVYEAERTGHGINLFDVKNSLSLYQELKASGFQHVRLACGTETHFLQDENVCRENLQWNLKNAQEAGLKVIIDMHDNWTPEVKKGCFAQAEYGDELLARWLKIIQWAEPYDNVVEAYDLMNEPKIFCENESVTPYWEMLDRIVPALSKAAGDTPLLVEVNNMSNPGAVRFWKTPQGGENIIIGYHDYWPHMFTHQLVTEQGSKQMPMTTYPAFMPMIQWSSPSWNNDSDSWYYWDRWKCEAVSNSVYRVLVKTGLPIDCGELGVVGWAGKLQYSGTNWIQHAVQRMNKLGASWSFWGVHGGYTWEIPAWKHALLKEMNQY